MNEIICPHCRRAFQVDESGYAAIVQQIRTIEFDKEIHERLVSWENEKKAELDKVKAQSDLANKDTISKMDTEIQNLKAQLESSKKDLSIAVAQIEKDKDKEINDLQAKLSASDTVQQLAVAKALDEQRKELAEAKSYIVKLESDLKASEANHKIEMNNKEIFIQQQDRMHKEEIEHYKDMRLRMSTKMLGETLEQHCQNSFNQIRSTAFPTAYFEKDNEVSKESGSKGDYIFRDYVGDVETVSIMFDMKNESDTTATKKTNESFLKELDKDRREKHCEYAVLVSLLEQDNELYNSGIVDVSYRYPKMYVIRPQFFIPLISILANEARKNACVKQQLIAAQNRNIDITNFEADLENFKSGFLSFMTYAGNNFDEAEKRIENCRDTLNKVLENFQKMRKHLNTANNKLEDLTIKKLTKDRPSLQELFTGSNQ